MISEEVHFDQIMYFMYLDRHSWANGVDPETRIFTVCDSSNNFTHIHSKIDFWREV